MKLNPRLQAFFVHSLTLSIGLPIAVLVIALLPFMGNQLARANLQYNAVIVQSFYGAPDDLDCIKVVDERIVRTRESDKEGTDQPFPESCNASAYLVDARTGRATYLTESTFPTNFTGSNQIETDLTGFIPGEIAPDGTRISITDNTARPSSWFFDTSASYGQHYVFLKDGKSYRADTTYLSEQNPITLGWVPR